jgi:uncharacterized membrane protein YwzB
MKHELLKKLYYMIAVRFWSFNTLRTDHFLRKGVFTEIIINPELIHVHG